MPRILVLYHFFHPDDVVSARIFTGLCLGLKSRGWDVQAAPCNRIHGGGGKYPAMENYGGIAINRVWRPPLPQASAAGRVANALWMTAAWALKSASRRHVPDVVLTGTDPILGYSSALAWKKLRPNVKLAHWCFDLYPDAAVADGILRPNSVLLPKFKLMASRALRAHDLIADLGPCMRERIRAYTGNSRLLTLPPWALEEFSAPLPVDREERRAIFGDARIAVLYSGNLGRAHCFTLALELARRCRHLPVKFAFAARGCRVPELKAALSPDDGNVAMIPFAEENRLASRLASADIHIMSLRQEWSGAVVPSKFFGSLAAGRPVIYDGAPDSDIGRLIGEYKTGWTLTTGNVGQMAGMLAGFCRDKQQLDALSSHCHAVYQKRFSKDKTIDAWDSELRRLLLPAQAQPLSACCPNQIP